MRDRIVYLIKYYFFWVLFFMLQKPVFMVWQHSRIGNIRWYDWLLVPYHGLPLDLSVAAYIGILVGVILCISVWTSWRVMRYVVDIVTGLLLGIGLWVMLGDNGCFPAWGYHLDRTVLIFLQSPQEVLACAPWWVWALGCVGFGVLFTLWWYAYRWWMRPAPQAMNTATTARRVTTTGVLFLLSALLFLPLRGSLTVSTMNTGRVYFSDNQQLNLAAINPVFNIVESLGENTFDVAKYTYMPSDEARELVDALYNSDTEAHDTFLRTPRPHIVLCILESFSMNAWEYMPRMQQLAQEGLFFSNTYANSYRTDRGVVAVMSAFPGQPTSSLMTVPYKSQHLPQISRDLKDDGYSLRFYYGGDEDFTNMRSYLTNGGFEQRMCDHDFPVSERMTKWGVPDHILFKRAGDEIVTHQQQSDKTLDVVLSLSSHEPFDIPVQHNEHPYLNAILYTDSCVGALADRLKESGCWDNTLMVLVADHGYPYPDGLANYDTLRYHIPLLMTGGVVASPREVTTLCSQIDWVPTLLSAMGMDYSAYTFAKDILHTRQPFAYYAFNDGFALLTPEQTIVIDAKVNKAIQERHSDEHLAQQARAMTQRVMETIEEW